MSGEAYLFLIAGSIAGVVGSLIGVVIFYLLKQIGEMKNRLAQSEQSNQALEESQLRITDLERLNRELRKIIEVLRLDASAGPAQAEYIAVLVNDLEERTRLLSEAHAKITKLNLENSDLRAGINPQSASLTEIEAELKQTLQEMDHLQIELATANMKLFELEKSQKVSPRSNQQTEVIQIEAVLKQTLQEMGHLQNELATANMNILELEKAQNVSPRSNQQTEVISSIVQELRQPVSSIVGYADLLLGESVGILGALQRKFMDRIKASTERIGMLLNDLDQVTRPEDVNPEFADLNLIVDNAMSITSSQLREKNISIKLDLPTNMPPIHTDREALQQILIHLIQNAGTASPVDGPVTLKIQTGIEEGTLIQVTDSGGGIPAEDLQRVFTRLYRADNAIQGLGDTGVGLSIAKNLTEALKGRIWVESEPGVGSIFSVTLPSAKLE